MGQLRFEFSLDNSIDNPILDVDHILPLQYSTEQKDIVLCILQPKFYKKNMPQFITKIDLKLEGTPDKIFK